MFVQSGINYGGILEPAGTEPLAENRDLFIEWTHKRKNSHYISMIR